MDSLTDTTWDVVISGTGLPQSLLALALSRSGKKILHIDQNGYYGGDEAALSLSEADKWADEHAGEAESASSPFSHAAVTHYPSSDESSTTRLGSARSYTLALAPQLLYARSNLLSALVSSKTHGQLEFQAVGSWFIVDSSSAETKLIRVPGGREDVFQDNTLDLKAKRSLMKFIRFVTNYEEQADTWQQDREKPFSVFLQDKFGLPAASHAPIIALALSDKTADHTTVEFAVPRISKYLTGIGLFGPGFGALLPKWGGLAEIGQVACRSCAVGGGVYVLGKGVTKVHPHADDLQVELSDGEKVTTRWLAGAPKDLGGAVTTEAQRLIRVSRSISIVSSPLSALFPRTSEGGPVPAGAVILVQPSNDTQHPIHILAHSAESGECVAGQSVLYASVAEEAQSGFGRLDQAIDSLLHSVGEEPRPAVLWKLQFEQSFTEDSPTSDASSPSVLKLKPISSDLGLEDGVLQDVKAAWQQITGDDADGFMKFVAREGTTEDEGNYDE